MRAVEKSGRTVDEAVAVALQELGVPSDRVKVDVLDEGKGGFLGIGAKPAVVRVTLLESRRERVHRFLEEVCATMEVGVAISVKEDDEYLHVDVTGSEAGILIGHHGQTLDALQYLLSLAASKFDGDNRRISLDVEGYRKRREETLMRLASRVADQVKRTGEPQTLEPMNAQERRVIHLALQESAHVETTSEGEDPFRRIVVRPKR